MLDYSVGAVTKQGKELIEIKMLKEMTDSEYDNIRTTMCMLGGHWNESHKAFLFTQDPTKVLSHMSVMTQKKDLTKFKQWQLKTQYYPTPPAIAQLMAAKLQFMSGDIVLEPSAGKGGLLNAVPWWVGKVAVECCKENADTLRANGYSVYEQKFEAFMQRKKRPAYNKVIMNPPFSGQRDALHTMLAYNGMHRGGTLIGIVSENTLYYDTPTTMEFRAFIERTGANVTELPYGTFMDSGTMIDTMLIEINKP